MIRFFSALVAWRLRLPRPAFADTATPDVKGLYLLSDYPAVTVQPGTTSTVTLHLHNYALPPERLSLSVAGVPAGWTATLLGGGQPVAAAMPATNDGVSLDLRLDVPKDAAIGTHTLTVSADGANSHITLPVAVTLAKELPAKLSLQPQLPELRGSTRSSFEYTMTIKNDSGKKLLVSLAADAPRNFDTVVHRGLWHAAVDRDPGRGRQDQGHQAQGDAARHRRCRALSGDRAMSPPKTPRPRPRSISTSPASRSSTMSGREGLLSARAVAGSETSVPILVTNTGTAPADNVAAVRAPRRRAGRSPSIRRPSTASRPTSTRKCRRASARRPTPLPATT